MPSAPNFSQLVSDRVLASVFPVFWICMGNVHVFFVSLCALNMWHFSDLVISAYNIIIYNINHITNPDAPSMDYGLFTYIR